MTHRLSEQEVDAIIAGCEGVTPGKWELVSGQWGNHSEDGGGGWHLLLGDSEGPLGGTISIRKIDYADGIYPEANGYVEAEANAAHIARLDPQTILSAFTELKQLRAQVAK